MNAALQTIRRSGWIGRLLLAALWFLPGSVRPVPAETNLVVTGPVVVLPPFVTSSKSKPWLYVRLGDFEVLSRCSGRATRDFAAELYRAYQLFYALVPANMRVQPSAPTAYILYAEDMSVALPPAIRLKLRAENLRQIRTPPNFMLVDRDEVKAVVLYPSRDSDFELHPDFLNLMIGGRVPPLPGWFLVGFTSFYQRIGIIISPDSAWKQFWSTILSRPDQKAVSVGPLTWISPQVSDAIRNDAEYPRRLLPLQELFADQLPAEAKTDSEYLAVWQAETALFVRWAFDGQHPDRQEAFWKFVELASTEPPVTESMFEQCFGLNYSDMLDRLLDYQSTAVAAPLQIALGKLADVPEFKVTPATLSEVGRITGDWERLEAGYARKPFPELVDVYLTQARQTLAAAQARDPQDAAIAAVSGLCEADAGNADGARPFLERAVNGGVARPRAYLELARLRYAEARKAWAGPDGRLSREQAVKIAEPLLGGMRQKPALPEMYSLLADVWRHCAAPLPPDSLAALLRGAGLFPRDAGYALMAASVFAIHDQDQQASILIEQGLKIAPDGPVKEQLMRLKTSLMAAGK